MSGSAGRRLAAVDCPPVTAFPRGEPDATTHQARCAKRSARSPTCTDGSGANASSRLPAHSRIIRLELSASMLVPSE